jgi:hypothetical protein
MNNDPEAGDNIEDDNDANVPTCPFNIVYKSLQQVQEWSVDNTDIASAHHQVACLAAQRATMTSQ